MMKKGKNFLNFLFTLFLGGFFGISASAIYTASYEIIKWGIVFGYVIIAYLLIKGVRDGWRYPVGYERGETKYDIRKFAKIISLVLLIIFIFGLIYLIGSGTIENIAKLIAEWLSNNLHMEGGKAPRIEIK